MKKRMGSRTEHNLMAAFAGESQARNRYTFFAKIASKEGHEGIAAAFLETAEHERMHAKRYFDHLEGMDVEIKAAYPGRIGNTAVNLEAAAAGEHEEWANLYPTFGKIAEEEGFAAAAAIFRRVAEVEVEHEKRYLRLLEHVKAGTLYMREVPIRWKCAKCGRIHVGTEAPKRCPTCDHPQGWFIPVEANY
ncbi:rubrerythrin [Candidatus Deferrimicrobium sp.]|jgi:rubrerythrin|uniref:rubrerythrin n=1 Tax=Candidatus Deferrimicrobium sp. TaxID=3060586 RepID=UPI002EDB813C